MQSADAARDFIQKHQIKTIVSNNDEQLIWNGQMATGGPQHSPLLLGHSGWLVSGGRSQAWELHCETGYPGGWPSFGESVSIRFTCCQSHWWRSRSTGKGVSVYCIVQGIRVGVGLEEEAHRKAVLLRKSFRDWVVVWEGLARELSCVRVSTGVVVLKVFVWAL